MYINNKNRKIVAELFHFVPFFFFFLIFFPVTDSVIIFLPIFLQHKTHSGCEKVSTVSNGFSFSTSERSSEKASPIFSPVFEEHSMKGIPNSAASAAP